MGWWVIWAGCSSVDYQYLTIGQNNVELPKFPPKHRGKDCLNLKDEQKERGKGLEKRTLRFAVQIIKLTGELPNTEAGKVVKYQMVKAGTSIGAYYSPR
ncbi:hypothetical protein ISS37_00680 [candidate division KSB1 bacterium]|nr:hypothetical protein [candidate division KSB1 bacterium]